MTTKTKTFRPTLVEAAKIASMTAPDDSCIECGKLATDGCYCEGCIDRLTDEVSRRQRLVTRGKNWSVDALERLLSNTLKGTMTALLFLVLGACQTEGLTAGNDSGEGSGPHIGPGQQPDSGATAVEVGLPDLARPLIEPAVDGSVYPVDKPVDIQVVFDLSVGDSASDPVTKAGDEVQPDVLADVQPDLTNIKLDTAPDLMTKKDAELLGTGKSCTLDNQCQAGNHCSSLVGRCCLTSCAETGCWKGCGEDGVCIWCSTCTCTASGQCHC